MNFKQLLAQMQANNISMSATDGKLKVFDPDKRLNPVLLAALKSHKPELIAFISEGRGFTQSDFKYATLTTAKIDALQRSYPMLQNLYITTPMQRGMLFHGMLETSDKSNSGGSYTTQLCADLEGELNVDAFKHAWNEVVKRHDVYRTCFVGFDLSMVHQLVQREAKLPFIEHDWQPLDAAEQQQKLAQFRRADKTQGFDFAIAPMMRITLIRLATNRYHLVWSQHHALTDGWCGPIVFGEVNELYLAKCAARQAQLPPVVRYENYIAWLSGQDNNQARNFWQDHLAAFNAPTPMAIDRLPNDNDGQQGLVKLNLHLNEAKTAKLDAFARENECTVNVLLQAAWAYLLHRYSGENSVMFGSTVSGRPADLPGIENIVGLFINTVPVGVSLDEQMTLKALLQSLQQQNAARDQFSYLSLSDIHELSRVPKGQPLFNSLLVFENFPTENTFSKANAHNTNIKAAYELNMKAVAVDENTNYDITLGAFMQQTLHIKIGYRLEQISTTAMQRVYNHLEQILCQMADLAGQPNGSDMSVMALNFLSEAELGQAQQATPNPPPSQRPLGEQFEAQASKTPEATALVFEDQQWTFCQLNQKANQIAHYLINQGVKPGALVALCVQRSVELVPAILGIIKAGAAYVPLEPDLPANRQRFIVEDTAVDIILTQTPLAASNAFAQKTVLCVDQPKALAHFPTTNPEGVAVTTNDLAYVIYTSGSTGVPKGVMVEQQNLCNFIDVFKQQLSELAVPEDSGWLFSASYAFDASVKGILALLLGKKVVVATSKQSRDAHALANLLVTQQIGVFNGVPQLAELVIDQLNLSQHQQPIALIVGGEAINAHSAEKIMDYCQQTGAKAINAYGPTELTINASYALIEANQPINIGRPVPGSNALVLAQDLTLLPVGAIGELYVGGRGVVRGYLNSDELTDQRFIKSPFGAQTLYKTGDKVCWMQNAQGEYYLDFLGRVDTQVKIRGFRIELGEIETALASHSDVADCKVLIKTNDNRVKELLAFVVATSKVTDETRYTDTLFEHLRLELPDPSIPGTIMVLDKLPMTPGGKVDTRVLLTYEKQTSGGSPSVAPRTEMEQKLCLLWQQVLGKTDIGIDDNFFELGGSSILAMQVMGLSMQQGIMVNPGQLFSHRTVRALAALLAPNELALDESAPDVSNDDILMLMNNSQSKLKLFCMPPFGGLASSYGQLGDCLSDVAKVYGFQAPELFSDDNPYTLPDLAKYYVEHIRRIQPNGPYHLAGWSTGGVIAYEVAHQLSLAGETNGYLALFDALPSEPKIKRQQVKLGGKPTWFSSIKSLYGKPLDIDWSTLANLTEDKGRALVEAAFINQNMAPQGVSEQMIKRYLRHLGNFALNLFDHDNSHSQLDIDLFKVKQIESPNDPEKIDFNHFYNWDELTDGTVSVIPVQGEHKSLLQPPNIAPLAQQLAERLGAKQ